MAHHSGDVRDARLSITGGDPDDSEWLAADLGNVEEVQRILETAGCSSMEGWNDDDEGIGGFASGSPGRDRCRVLVIRAAIKERQGTDLECLTLGACRFEAAQGEAQGTICAAVRSNTSIDTENAIGHRAMVAVPALPGI